ncbi:MarR family winged helix-turn-helix transcriptional regulator [Acinetobacter sp. CE-15]|uniref:MarR family winged helix-turn-helix transcriptional regulator n=1 Tax=Acinetobacter sp. CE-15 TaxID=3425693 RepID=UPI003DA24FD4
MYTSYKNFLLPGKKFSLENSPIYWISQVHNQYVKNIDYALKIYGLDDSRRQILLALKAKNNSTISDLSKLMIYKMSTTTKIVQRLKDEGFVDTYCCQIDSRYTRVILTNKGEDAIHKINDLSNIILTQSLEGLSKLEVEKTLENLKYIFKKLSR